MTKRAITLLILALAAFVLMSGYVLMNRQGIKVPAFMQTLTPTPLLSLQPTDSTGTKLYRNEEWGFEFEYPEGWSFHPSMFGSPFSKFNLIGASPEEGNIPSVIAPAVLVNIVTPEFADRAFYGLNGVDTVVAHATGKKYVYEFEGATRISIDIPLDEYRMLLGASKANEEIFNQVLASFKFFAPTNPSPKQ